MNCERYKWQPTCRTCGSIETATKTSYQDKHVMLINRAHYQGTYSARPTVVMRRTARTL